MKTLTNYPPLTPDDIHILRGQPLAKMIKSVNYAPQEEWIYYNIKEKNKEIYIFKNRKLVSYKNNLQE
jgi:hypothetical protein